MSKWSQPWGDQGRGAPGRGTCVAQGPAVRAGWVCVDTGCVAGAWRVRSVAEVR